MQVITGTMPQFHSEISERKSFQFVEKAIFSKFLRLWQLREKLLKKLIC